MARPLDARKTVRASKPQTAEAAQKRRERERQRYREKRLARPFVGCDGEGIGRAEAHRYALFRMGERELYKDGRRLETPELLDFIARAPAGPIYVGFAFEYDIAQILRDVPAARDPAKPGEASRLEWVLGMQRKFEDEKAGQVVGDFKVTPWTWLDFKGWPKFGVQYLPRHYLRVCYADPDWHGSGPRALKESIITIWDVFGNFRSTFLKALTSCEVGQAAELSQIGAMKDKRASFEAITPEVGAYCALECDLLAQLMTQFREDAFAAGIEPTSWDGAGRLASAMLKAGGAMRRTEIERKLPKALLDLAMGAYYGGRFEVMRAGPIAGPVFEHDINSAFAGGLLASPCLRHGRWRRAEGLELERMLRDADRLGEAPPAFLAPASFSHPKDAFICGLPFRSPTGALSWPREGNGVYWSNELHSAAGLGAKLWLGKGWVYQKACSCTSHDFLRSHYAHRLALGKSGRGEPIKGAIASVYGKRAQRIGAAPWGSPIDASFSTAHVRAQLNHVIAQLPDPKAVVMLATDALYTVGEPAPVDVGRGLGQWEVIEYPSLFVVRPGLYWPPIGRMKTRGIAAKFFTGHVGEFEAEWADFLADCETTPGVSPATAAALSVQLRGAPAVMVNAEAFIGLRLAYRQNDLASLGQWVAWPFRVAFEWADKRVILGREGETLILGPKAGDENLWSLAYQRGKPLILEPGGDWRGMEAVFEAMPDVVDLGPPGK